MLPNLNTSLRCLRTWRRRAVFLIRVFENKMTKNPIDEHVGDGIRRAREKRGMDLQRLATSAGVALDKIEKYETGCERIGANDLIRIASALGVGITCFFEGISADDASRSLVPDATFTDEALGLARVFARVRDPIARKTIIVLTQLLASPSDGESVD